jgi:membrane protease YdiL (CAAX protease family)
LHDRELQSPPDIGLRQWLETLADPKARAASALIAGVLIMVMCMAARFVIYWTFPVRSVEKIPGLEAVIIGPGYEWWVRDTIMDVPRLVAFGLTLWVGHYFWGFDGLGWHARRWRLGLVWGSVGAALILSGSLLGTESNAYPLRILAVLSLSSIIVALHEETLFRGVLFNALRDVGGGQWAIWAPTALFTVYHVQAQPIEGWPSIFASGLLLVVLRWQGVGLVWLVLSHAVGDSIIYFGSHGSARTAWWPPLALVLRLCIPVAYFVWAKRPLGLNAAAATMRLRVAATSERADTIVQLLGIGIAGAGIGFVVFGVMGSVLGAVIAPALAIMILDYVDTD